MRYVSPTGFAAIILFFALPFGAAVDCDGVRHYDWTGVDLLTASVESGPEDASDAAEVEERWIFAWPVFLCAVAGLVLGIYWRGRYAGFVAAAGVLATFALLVIPETVAYEQPEWVVIVLLTFAVLMLVHAMAAATRWWDRRKKKRAERHESPQQAFR
jgi:hypothetical protein